MELKNSQWITTARDLGDVCPAFRKCFHAEKEISSATLEITALGVMSEKSRQNFAFPANPQSFKPTCWHIEGDIEKLLVYYLCISQ